MIAAMTLSLLIITPLVLTLAAGRLALRTGDYTAWVIGPALGVIASILCLFLPVDQWINSRARWSEGLAFVLGIGFPALVLTILSFKRWPAFPAAQGSSETSQ